MNLIYNAFSFESENRFQLNVDVWYMYDKHKSRKGSDISNGEPS